LRSTAEPGSYTLQILTKLAERRAVLTFSGIVETKDGNNILQAPANLSSIPPGAYHLAIRHDSGDWRYYRILVS